MVAAVASAAGETWTIDRRRDPFPTEPGYRFLPLPYSVAGVGSGVYLTFYEANYFDFLHRAYLLGVIGDVTGAIAGVDQVHLIPRRLLLAAGTQNFNVQETRSFTSRGMDAAQNDFSILQYNRFESYETRLTLTTLERRVETWVTLYEQTTRAHKLLNRSNHVIAALDKDKSIHEFGPRVGLQADFTDDYLDPRFGVRVAAEYLDQPRQQTGEPDFYRVDLRVNGYLPIGTRNTWAVTAVKSDARLRSAGDTDPASLAATNNLNCAPADQVCAQAQAGLVANDLARNSAGTSLPLGGRDYLRAYPQDRFHGAHTLVFATELRVNATEESKPFYLYITRGVRTNVQVAFFAEAGSVSETEGAVGQTWRSDVGAGLRLLTASGLISRFDAAAGAEGSALQIVVDYPW